MKRMFVLLVLTGCLVTALGAVAHASGGESGGIHPTMLATKR